MPRKPNYGRPKYKYYGGGRKIGADATRKQKALMLELGIDIPNPCSKRVAKMLIDSANEDRAREAHSALDNDFKNRLAREI